MGETVQERKTFKWGDSEYYLDDLLKLHTAQKSNYEAFARARGGYDDTAIEGLRTAMENRISAAKTGSAFGADGVLDTDQVDNVSIQTQKNRLFKKAKYSHQDNTEWAKYYMNQLISNLSPVDKAKSTSGNASWDINKNGYAAYLTGRGYDAQKVFEEKDKKSDSDPNAPRSFAERDAFNLEKLKEYRAHLATQNFNFSKDDNAYNDDYLAQLDSFINNYNDYDSVEKAAKLKFFGANDAWTNAFTSDKWILNQTSEQAAEAAEKAKSDEAEQLKTNYLRAYEDLAYSNRRSGPGVYHTVYDYSKSKNGTFESWYNDLNKSQKEGLGTYLTGADKASSNANWGNAWNTLMTSMRNGTEYKDANIGVLLQGTFIHQPNGFIDLGNGQYLIKDSINDMGQAYTYDPNSGYTKSVYLGDYAGKNDEIKDIFTDLAYKYTNKTHGTSYSNRSRVFEVGGSLVPKYEYGNSVSYNWAGPAAENAAKAKENNISEEKQARRDRYISSKNESAANPDAGFTTAEYIRLGSILGDLTSLVLDPVSGTAVGLASSTANLVADVTSDGFDWRDVGNFATSVGLDLLGAIPVWGDALGTGTKIAKNLAKFAPRIMNTLAAGAAIGGVANAGAMMESWNKMLSKDDTKKMTVEDWRNIAQSISLVTGGVRAGRNIAHKNKVQNAAQIKDAATVTVRDKQSGAKQVYILHDDQAKALAKAKSPEEVEKILGEFEMFRDKFGQNGTLEVATQGSSWQKPWRTVKKDGGKDGVRLQWIRGKSAAIGKAYDFTNLPDNGLGHGLDDLIGSPNWYKNLRQKANARYKRTARNLNTGNEVDMAGQKTTYETAIENLEADLAKHSQAAQTSMARRRQTITDKQAELQAERDRLQEIQKQLDLTYQNSDEALRLNDLNSQVTAQEGVVNQARQKLESLTDPDLFSQSEAENLLNSELAYLEQLKALREEAKTKLSDLTSTSRKAREESKITISRLEALLQKLDPKKTGTNATRRFNEKLNDLRTNHTTVEGRSTTWDMEELKRKYGMTNAFHFGGSINRNKLDKYINYAKR